MALEAIRTSGYREYVNYDIVKQDNREVATSFHWQLDFTKMPSGVYIPPATILHVRIKSVDVPALSLGGLIETSLHGWKFYQHGLNDYSGEFTVNGVDFIDESLQYAFREMVYEADRPYDHTAKPKEEMMWDAVLTECNNQDVPIHKWYMRDCLLSGYTVGKSFNDTKDANSDVSFSWSSSLITEEQLNISALA